MAGEVKELAQETARATEDIARRVEAIQADTTGAVAAIGEIATIIASINDYQLTIASAVEEQTATTNEMSRGVAEAATGSGEIAANITGVATSARDLAEVLAQMGGVGRRARPDVRRPAHPGGRLHLLSVVRTDRRLTDAPPARRGRGRRASDVAHRPPAPRPIGGPTSDRAPRPRSHAP